MEGSNCACWQPSNLNIEPPTCRCSCSFLTPNPSFVPTPPHLPLQLHLPERGGRFRLALLLGVRLQLQLRAAGLVALCRQHSALQAVHLLL